jgi:hypothetical protein
VTRKTRVKASASRPRTRTEEQSAADARAYAALQRTARARAFRYIMVNGHGCTGRACTAPGHAEHLSERLLPALMALGVLEDPETRWAPNGGYHVKLRRRAGAA